MDRLKHRGIDQEAVILDIGAAYTKCGYSGETTPRYILATPQDLYASTDLAEATSILKDFMRIIFFHKLQCKPKEGATLVAEDLMAPRHVMEALHSVLFSDLQIPLVYNVWATSLPLYTSGLYTGIVIECGHMDTQIMPIYEGFPLIKGYMSIPASSMYIKTKLGKSNQQLDDVLCEELLAKVTLIPYGELRQKLKDCDTEAKSYSIKKSNSDEELSLKLSDRIIPQSILFGDVENDESNIAYDLLRSVSKLDLHIRREVIQNIIVSGGTAMIPGFLPRFDEELMNFIDTQFAEMQALRKFFHFTQTIYPRNLLTWIGGSVVGQLHAMERFGLSREDYLESGSSDRLGLDYFFLQK